MLLGVSGLLLLVFIIMTTMMMMISIRGYHPGQRLRVLDMSTRPGQTGGTVYYQQLTF